MDRNSYINVIDAYMIARNEENNVKKIPSEKPDAAGVAGEIFSAQDNAAKELKDYVKKEEREERE